MINDDHQTKSLHCVSRVCGTEPEADQPGGGGPRARQGTDIRYSVFVEDDGKTFLHLLFCANDEAEQVFFRLPSQQAFQAGLAASHLEVPPTMTTLGLVGATSDLL